MSHLLASVNPAAAERIEDPTMDAPDVGTVVVYRARQGMMRMGRTEFPAIVLGHDSEGHLQLFVLMEPEDMMMEDHVRPWAEGNNDHGHCWRHVELDPVEESEDDRREIEAIKSAYNEQNESMEALRSELAVLKKIVLGDYKPAKLSVYDLLAEFEGKLKGKKKG